MYGLGLHCDGGSARDMIKNHGLFGRVGNGTVMDDKTFLRCLVIIRRHGKNRVRTVFAGVARHADGFSCIVAPRPRNNGYAPIDSPHGVAKKILMFAIGKNGAFARRSGKKQRRYAVFDLIFDQSVQRFIIDLSVPKGRDQRGTGADKNGFHNSPLFKRF